MEELASGGIDRERLRLLLLPLLVVVIMLQRLLCPYENQSDLHEDLQVLDIFLQVIEAKLVILP